MEDLTDPNKNHTCPYNPAHSIRAYKMSVHLTKCRKSYPDSERVTCDFNVNHRIHLPELQYHHKVCRDRKQIESQVIASSQKSEKFPVMGPPVLESSTSENWDDLNVKSYDPQSYCENNHILRMVQVEGESKRKHFREAEKRRLAHLRENKAAPAPQPATSNGPPTTSVTAKMVFPTHRQVPEGAPKPQNTSELLNKIKRDAEIYVP